MTISPGTQLSQVKGSLAPPETELVAPRVVAGNKMDRPGDDLLRHLPANRHLGTALASPVVSSQLISSARMDQLLEMSAALGIQCDRFFMLVFAALLSRLADQEVVQLRSIGGDPGVLTFRFDPESSFRSAMPSPHPAADGPCAIEYVFGSAELSRSDLPRDGLRMAVQLSEGATHTKCQVWLASSTGRWRALELRLWLRYFETLLEAAASTPDVPWRTLPLLKEKEVQEFYLTFNGTATPYPDNVCVHQQLVRQAEQTPDAIAIIADEQALTYRQLDERSNTVAQRLQALGAGPGRPVAISLERTALLPVALLGILKSGSCYVPLDQQDSPLRLASILEECRPAAMVVDHSFPLLKGVDGIPLVYLDKDADPSPSLPLKASGVTVDHPAYIIYTSGTTGKPKGVIITHRALSNLIETIRRKPGFTSTDRMLAISPISFDIATMDMFLPLLAGGTLVVGDRLVGADPSRLAALLEKFEITVLQATPPTWRLLVSSEWEGKRGLKMISGGETLPRDLADRLLELGGELFNCYGPTETTIYSSVLQIQTETSVVPTGPPIANTAFYVLDQSGRLLPPGVPGELYIGGTGVSPGYVASAQEARQRFLTDPYAQVPGSRMFRTGDAVRLINGNEFEFLGRLDHQVKLRGYRIEMGEVEAALRTFPGVQNAVVALRDHEPGAPYLSAYFTAVDEHLDLRRLRHHVSSLLPTYMVPSRFVLMEAIPLTPSGKIDRKTLLASASAGLSAYRQPLGVEPRTDLEEKLLKIFREVLNTAEFGITDSFFDFGGYSLLTVRLFNRIHRALKLRLPISLLFDASTVEALAQYIESERSLSLIVPIRPRGKTAPLFVIHSYLLYEVLPRICEPDRPVYGVRESPHFSPSETIADRAAICVGEILRLCPDGPLSLTGWCAAGSLTVEIARQLQQLGHQVGLVALLDAERPGYRPDLRGSRTAGLRSRARFHLGRFRGISVWKKLAYIQDAVRHSWNTMFESFFMRHHRSMMRLQGVIGFLLPKIVFNNAWSRVAALQNYAPSRYPGRLVLFRAADVPQLPNGDLALGWNEIADDEVEVVFVPGDHESMFHHPNVELFSTRFREVLQQAEELSRISGRFDRVTNPG